MNPYSTLWSIKFKLLRAVVSKYFSLTCSPNTETSQTSDGSAGLQLVVHYFSAQCQRTTVKAVKDGTLLQMLAFYSFFSLVKDKYLLCSYYRKSKMTHCQHPDTHLTLVICRNIKYVDSLATL